MQHARQAQQHWASLGIDDDYDGDGISCTERAHAMLADVVLDNNEETAESEHSEAGEEEIGEEMGDTEVVRESLPGEETLIGGRMEGCVFVVSDM